MAPCRAHCGGISIFYQERLLKPWLSFSTGSPPVEVTPCFGRRWAGAGKGKTSSGLAPHPSHVCFLSGRLPVDGEPQPGPSLCIPPSGSGALITACPPVPLITTPGRQLGLHGCPCILPGSHNIQPAPMLSLALCGPETHWVLSPACCQVNRKPVLCLFATMLIFQLG